MATGWTTDAPPFRLHWSPDSANLPVRIALELFGLTFETVRVDRARGAQRSPGYLALNPQGLIPVLEHRRPGGDLVLFETGAILLHLAEHVGRFGPDGPLATDPTKRATALRWVFFLSNTLHAELRVAFYADRFVPAAGIGELRAGIARRVQDHLTLLETALNAGGLLGPPTVLDVYMACCVRWAQIYPSAGALLPDGAGGWTKLYAVLAALEEEPSVTRAVTAERIPADGPFTAPRYPDFPEAEVTGGMGD